MDMSPPSQVSEHLGLNEAKQMQTSVSMSKCRTLFSLRASVLLLEKPLNCCYKHFLLLLSLGSAMIFFGLNMNILAIVFFLALFLKLLKR